MSHAARLYDWLSQKYQAANEHVFMDFEAIRAGGDWELVLEDNLAKCNVCVAVIGDKWLDEMQRRNEDGENDQDFVRRELATALGLGKLVIPYLVKPVAEPPRKDQLPPSLERLPRAQAVFADHSDWGSAVERLIASFSDAPPVPGRALGQQIVDLFEADNDPPTCLGRTRTSLNGDLKTGRWKTQEYPVQDGPPPNPNWLLVSEFVARIRSDHSPKPQTDESFEEQPSTKASVSGTKLKGSQIQELALRGEGPKMMGRAGGLTGSAITEDVESGRWKDQVYQVSDDETQRRNWFRTEEFLSRVT